MYNFQMNVENVSWMRNHGISNAGRIAIGHLLGWTIPQLPSQPWWLLVSHIWLGCLRTFLLPCHRFPLCGAVHYFIAGFPSLGQIWQADNSSPLFQDLFTSFFGTHLSCWLLHLSGSCFDHIRERSSRNLALVLWGYRILLVQGLFCAFNILPGMMREESLSS